VSIATLGPSCSCVSN